MDTKTMKWSATYLTSNIPADIYIYNNKVPRMSYPLHNIMYMNWNVPREEFINTPTT